MRVQRNLIFITCITVASLKTGVLATTSDIEDCNTPIHLQNTDCCTSKKDELFTNFLFDQECTGMLFRSEVSSYEKLEDSLECFFQCLFTKVDMVNERNKVIFEDILANITKELKPDFKDLSINRITQCIENDYIIKESSRCKSGALQLFLCVHREKILNCPEELWKNSDECNKYKSVLEKCKNKTPLFQLLQFDKSF
uniref:Odorant binding protein 27 n=1 Tax=Nezara viridula TaxID=85310 RepID=A0A4Y5RDG3_NEZVI|nr:odorant binding protein 27 [Nezara viridula]